MISKRLYLFLFLLPFLVCRGEVNAQTNKITRGLSKEKPEQYKNQKLRSERTGEKKMGLMAKFFQNTASHYNYIYNANNKIDQVIENARIAEKPDYTQLLPYYSYSADNTSSQQRDLDSVIEKSSAGILLHDLRTNWVDNFYLLMGKAYYLSGKFDSAYMAFQFINYNLRPEDKQDDQHSKKAIGSNENKGSTVASKEDRTIIKKALTTAPSRNDALVWQIRTLTDMDMYAEASSLINILQNDTNFPERLDGQLNEVVGYWFYKQGMFDSSIHYIKASLSTAIDNQDLARKEYLLGQLYENRDNRDTADSYYAQSQKHATDPLLDIYASLKRVQLFAEGEPQAIRDGIARLAKMAKREKFFDYQQQIYFLSGNLGLDIPDTLTALKYFYKSAHSNTNEPDLKADAQYKIAEINYGIGNYKEAYAYYDSLSSANSKSIDQEAIAQKRDALRSIVRNLDIIDREDSLQTIALLPTKEREKYLKKLSKKLRKDLNLDDEDFDFDNDPFGKKNKDLDLFSQNEAKGKWYFYNNNAKSKGFADFQRVWGKRSNTDNWRTKSTTSAAGNNQRNRLPQPLALTGDPLAPVSTVAELTKEMTVADISVDGLRANLPLTDTLLQESNNKIAEATFSLGKDYQNLLGDYPKAIDTYHKSLEKFPDKLYNGELPLNLSYCYRMTGDAVLAKKYANMVTSQFPKSESADIILHPDKHNPKIQDSLGTSTYDRIYRLFIRGDFDEALAEKSVADRKYGEIHWTPQLLYIEAIYYIKKREDSTALKMLSDILEKYPGSPLAQKAENMSNVLKKRSEIEKYLTDLEVERLPEDTQIVVFDDTRAAGNIFGNRLERDDTRLLPMNQQVTTGQKPVLKEDQKVKRTFTNQSFELDIFAPQKVVMMLTDVDPVYISEANRAMSRYANTKFYGQKIETKRDTLDEHRVLLVFSDFLNAEEAVKAMQQIGRDAKKEISWLPADTYSFYFISEDNLELLKENKKLDDYLSILKNKYPDLF